MPEFKYRKLGEALIDVILLIFFLKIGFTIRPAERPAEVMLITAAATYLIILGRSDRFGRAGLIAAVVIAMLYIFYWERPADAFPLLLWGGGQFGWRRLSRYSSLIQRAVQSPSIRYIRVLLIVTGGIGLMWPYLARGLVGAGDARWYANTVADYVVQMRAGFFPLWIGQSDYSFYGGIFPLRMAPYLAHLTGIIDLLTARQLPPYAVINAALVVSLIAGLMTMYVSLGRISGERPWINLGLAFCYGLCPGVLGLAYAQDLYMSFCTLPFLPVALLGVVRSFDGKHFEARLLMAGGVAATWLAHPPIGLWCGLVVGVTQIVRLCTQNSWRHTWKYDVAGAGCFVLLAGYSFVSVWSLGPRANVQIPVANLDLFLKNAFPGNWLPIQPTGISLHNLQLGYGLTALAVAVAIFARASGPRLVRVFLWCTAGLIVLLLPIPYLTEHLWGLLPQAVLNITNIFPMQRLLVVSATCVVMASAVWLRGIRSNDQALTLFRFLLSAALIWGGLEASKFIDRANQISPGWNDTMRLFRPENRDMTHSVIDHHQVQPRYFNHGVTDYQLEHRFLSLDRKEIIRNATDAIIAGFGPGTGGEAHRLLGQFTGKPEKELVALNLEPRFTLEPNKHYLLVLEFLNLDYTGVLKFEGQNFMRVYGLPEAGNERAFGAKRANARWLSLWQTTGQPEEVRLLWLPTKPGAQVEAYIPFANYKLLEYDPTALDVVVESLLPYRAVVKAPAASYLETPRLYIPNYSALVDGRPAPVEMSPDGFVMVRLEPGRHVLELHYLAPIATRLAYYLGLASWLIFAVASVRHFRRPKTQPFA